MIIYQDAEIFDPTIMTVKDYFNSFNNLDLIRRDVKKNIDSKSKLL